MTERRLEYLRLSQLQRAPRNPKGHDEAGIATSVGRLGFLEPVIVDERTGRLVGGHGRLDWAQAQQAAGSTPPEGVAVADDGEWMLPTVRGWASRSDADAEAALVALNRLTEAGGWQVPDLVQLLDDLASEPGGLDGTGYTADDLDDLLAQLTDGGQELPPEPTDAAHAEHVGRGDPAPPREVQGLREVGLMFQADHHREYVEHLARLKRAWNEDAAPVVVLRALREAAERVGATV